MEHRRPSRITASNPIVCGWAEDPVLITDDLLREAHAIAMAQRVADEDPSGIPASYLAPIVQRLLHPPKKHYDRSWRISNQAIDAKARELGMNARGGEGYREFADRLETEDRRRQGYPKEQRA